MRSGKPCSCGCTQCNAYCDQSEITDNCFLNTDYLIFNEKFDGPLLTSGWDTGSIIIKDGEGAAPTGTNYVEDSVTGAELRDPMLCSYFYGKIKVNTTTPNSGGVSFSLSGGPAIYVSSGDVSYTLPNGSSVVIDEDFQSGDYYSFTLSHNLVPVNDITQRFFVHKHRFSSTQPCESGLYWDGSGISPYFSSTTGPPNSTGTQCSSRTCLLINGYYKTPASVYSIASPVKYNVSISGAGWSVDDICLRANEPARLKMIPFGVEISGGICRQTCDHIIPEATVHYSGCGVDDKSSPIYMSWTALNTHYLRQDNQDSIDWRCYGDLPTLADSGIEVFLKTRIKSYSVDFMQPNIWHHVPIAARNHTNIRDEFPFNEIDQYSIGFTGFPCVSDCYGPYFGAMDNILVSDSFNLYQHNFEFLHGDDEGCLQIGSSSGLPNGATRNETFWADNASFMVTIPRDDIFSSVRVQSGGFASNNVMGFWRTPVWNVEKNGFFINWNNTKGWWEGIMHNLVASGGISDSGGYLDGGPWDSEDFSRVYKSGICDYYNFYLNTSCILTLGGDLSRGVNFSIFHSGTGEQVKGVGGNSLGDSDWTSSQTPLYTIATTLATDDYGSCIELFVSDPGMGGLGEGGEYICKIIRNPHLPLLRTLGDNWYINNSRPSGIFDNGYDQIDCTGLCGAGPSGGEPLVPSGYYGYELYDAFGYLLDVGDDFEVSKLPFMFMDPMGNIIRRVHEPHNVENYYHESELSRPCVGLARKYSYYTADGSGVSLIAGNSNEYYRRDGRISLCINSTGSNPTNLNSDIQGTFPYWEGICVGYQIAHDTPLSYIDPANPSYDGSDWSGILDQSGTYNAELTHKKGSILTCYIKLFLDAESQELKAYITPNTCAGNKPYLGDPEDWYIIPTQSFIKSQADMLNGSYFGKVTVLETDPLKIYIKQPFMSWGVPDNGTLEDDCEAYRLYGYTIETILEAPKLV